MNAMCSVKKEVEMKSGRIILIALMMTGCFVTNTMFGQYNSSATPRGNTGASKAIKKSALVNKKYGASDSKTQSTNSQATKKPAASTPAKTTAVKKSAAPKKVVVTTDPAPVTTATVSPVKKEVNYDYRNAIGIRAGQTSGITFKHFFSSNEAIEAILGLWPNAVGITGLYEKYVPSENVNGFSWYFGGGGHMSFSTKRLYTVYHEGRYYSYRSTYPGFGIGIDGIVGAEYKIPTAPLAISFDIKPFIEVNGSGVIFTAFDPGLGIKFTLK
jgi:hypothetical protein